MVKKETNDYQFATVLGVSVLVGSLLASLVIIRPLYQKNSELRAEKAKQEERLSKLQEKEKVLLSLKDKSGDIKKDSERVSNALPTSAEIGRLFIQLDEIAKISGGTLRSVGTENSNQSTQNGLAGINSVNYSLPIDMPSYFALKKFFESSEEALRLLSINGLRIDSSDTGVLSVNLNAQSYTRVK